MTQEERENRFKEIINDVKKLFSTDGHIPEESRQSILKKCDDFLNL